MKHEIAEIYISLVQLIQEQPWVNLIDWDLVNRFDGQLWIYRHGSRMHESEAIVITGRPDGYLFMDVPNRNGAAGDAEQILKAFHRALTA